VVVKKISPLEKAIVTKKCAGGNDKLISERAFWLGLGLYAFLLIPATIGFGGNVPQSQTNFASEVNGTGIQLAEQPSLNRSSPLNVTQVLPEMGDLSRWALFSLGNNGLRLSGSTEVQGDVGAAGNGIISIGGHAMINGNLYYQSNSILAMADGATITRARYDNRDSELDNGLNEASSASDHAFALESTRSYTSFNLDRNQSVLVTGAPGETVVLKLRSFTLSGNATFTLQGTATTIFIINVTKQFSLSGHSKIVLSGGLQWDNVLFNVRGQGNRVRLSGHSSFEGILMANQRTVKLRGHSTVWGEVIANRVSLRNSAQIIHSPVISP
jgi:cytoskeletal protein CcmA (bactofilin family)